MTIFENSDISRAISIYTGLMESISISLPAKMTQIMIYIIYFYGQKYNFDVLSTTVLNNCKKSDQAIFPTGSRAVINASCFACR